MKILAFSDWRVQSATMLNRVLQATNPDAILYAGDDLRRIVPVENDIYLNTQSHFIKLDSDFRDNDKLFIVNERNKSLLAELLNTVQNKLSQQECRKIEYNNIPLLYVNGNDDSFIEKQGKLYYRIKSLFLRSKDEYFTIKETSTKKLTFAKLRGYPSDTILKNRHGIYFCFAKLPTYGFNTIGNDITLYGAKCSYGLNAKIVNCPDKYADIWLSHIPPKGTLDLSVRFGCRHIGSSELLQAVKNYQPKFLISGHSHFWGGRAGKIGDTTILNVSSHDSVGAIGNYAVIDTVSNEYRFGTADFKNLRQIRGAHFSDILERRDIYSIGNKDFDQVVYSHNLLEQQNDEIIDQLDQNAKHRVADRIRSLQWDKPKVVKQLTFDPWDHALVDIETGLLQSAGLGGGVKAKLWLVGILFNNELQQFEIPEQEAKLIAFLVDNDIKDLVSWTNFDSKFLRRRKGFEKMKWIDAAKRVDKCVIWHSYRLHDLFKVLIDDKEEDMIDGAMAGIYADHLINRSVKCAYCPSEESIKAEIKKRNAIDLHQMHKLCEFLRNYEEV